MTTACGTAAEARRIAEALMAERLAASVHIAEVGSLYRWNDVVTSAAEWSVRIVTTRELSLDVVTRIQRLHSSELPETLIVAADPGTPAFAEWIAWSVA